MRAHSFIALVLLSSSDRVQPDHIIACFNQMRRPPLYGITAILSIKIVALYS